MRLFLVAVLLSLAGSLFSCRMTDDLAMSPEISKRVQPTADCTGKFRTLVPNEYLGEYWQNNGGGGNWQSIDEIGTPDGWYITEYGGMDNHWARFGFTNISNPHPSGVVSDLTLRIFAEDDEFSWMDVEVFTNGNLIRSASPNIYGPGIEEIELPFINMGSLASMNSLEVRVRSPFNIKVHSVNAELIWYVPNPDCPEPHQE